ncbi:MAG: hypothetical protein Edafosvirus5_35 [Edafosvirus sp.]|uniref:Uncharacterized protein n=1 Tax=Edafosvirus sp. TaxID=2487765 RepID=A0A3G4ZTB2_9VIRU|nr:MAG: hypothetical protein Edafosvirus5_35 [Edafosvirus sp.]
MEAKQEVVQQSNKKTLCGCTCILFLSILLIILGSVTISGQMDVWLNRQRADDVVLSSFVENELKIYNCGLLNATEQLAIPRYPKCGMIASKTPIVDISGNCYRLDQICTYDYLNKTTVIVQRGYYTIDKQNSYSTGTIQHICKDNDIKNINTCVNDFITQQKNIVNEIWYDIDLPYNHSIVPPMWPSYILIIFGIIGVLCYLPVVVCILWIMCCKKPNGQNNVYTPLDGAPLSNIQV